MKIKRPISVAAVTAVVLAAVVLAFLNWSHRADWKQTAIALQNLPRERVIEAIRAFARDRNATNSTVPLGELVSWRYLKIDDIGGLENANALVSISIDEMNPHGVLIRVPSRNGYDIVLMADGSIHGLRK